MYNFEHTYTGRKQRQNVNLTPFAEQQWGGANGTRTSTECKCQICFTCIRNGRLCHEWLDYGSSVEWDNGIRDCFLIFVTWSVLCTVIESIQSPQSCKTWYIVFTLKTKSYKQISDKCEPKTFFFFGDICLMVQGREERVQKDFWKCDWFSDVAQIVQDWTVFTNHFS